MKIVAITACPAGVAHTYMVAKAIEKEALSRGHEIKVEKQGTLGIDDELELQEIAAADIVIFAVSVAVEEVERFEDKAILEVNISEALHNPVAIIDEAEKMFKN